MALRLAVALAGTAVAAVLGVAPTPRYLTLAEARAVLQAMPGALTELASDIGTLDTAVFDDWVRRRDADVRSRVLRGEDDALVPLLLFGTSFTAAPRLTRAFFEQTARTASRDGSGQSGVERAFTLVFERRTDDLLRGLASPGDNVRLQWARDTLARHGHRLDSAAGRAAAGRFLVETFARVTRESEQLSSTLSTGQETSADLLRRAQAFVGRGLAPDTSWPIGFALERTLAELRAAGTIGPATVRRLVIVGPGLDVLDKDEGTDRHPPQSLQPFASIDSLLALGLAARDALRVTTIDVNPRVNAHLRALIGTKGPAALHLTLDTSRPWHGEALAYWAALGRHLSASTLPAERTADDGLRSRTVAVEAPWPSRLEVIDANVVFQRLDLQPGDRADLVLATNVLLYYGGLEQALAAASIAHMLRPGGVLLTNTSLDTAIGEVSPIAMAAAPPATVASAAGLARVAEVVTAFSSRPGDGERMFVYRKP